MMRPGSFLWIALVGLALPAMGETQSSGASVTGPPAGEFSWVVDSPVLQPS